MLPVANQEALLFTNKADDRVSVRDEILALGAADNLSSGHLFSCSSGGAGLRRKWISPRTADKGGESVARAAESPGSSKNESLGILSAGVCPDRSVEA